MANVKYTSEKSDHRRLIRGMSTQPLVSLRLASRFASKYPGITRQHRKAKRGQREPKGDIPIHRGCLRNLGKIDPLVYGLRVASGEQGQEISQLIHSAPSNRNVPFGGVRKWVAPSGPPVGLVLITSSGLCFLVPVDTPLQHT